MKKLQRVLALIMAIVMMMGTMSLTAFAASGEETDAAESDAWAWNADTKMLTLTGADVTETIKLPDGATVVVNGECSVKVEGANAIESEGAIAIGGSGKLTLTGANGIVADSVAISNIDVDITGGTYGIYAGNDAGDATVTLTNVDGSVTGGYAGIYAYGDKEESNASVTIDGCDLDATSTATSWNKRAQKSGITVCAFEAQKVETSINITNSKVNATGFDAGLSINNYMNDPEATNSASSRINITNSTVVANGTNGTWSGIFASVLGQHEDADSIITITNSSVYAVSPNTGILTSSQKGESKIVLDNSVLGASGKTALSMIEPTCQAQTAELKNGSTYVQMTPAAVMKGEIVNHDGKTIIATAGDGITYDAENNYYVIPQGSAVTESFTDGTSKEYTFNKQAGGVGGSGYAKEAVWGFDVYDYVCYIKETGVNYETLTDAVAAANASEGADTIVMLTDIDFDSNKDLTVKGNVVITGAHTIFRGAYTGTMFTVPADASLALDGITIDGDNNWTFDEETFKNDAIAGKTVNGDNTNYHTLEEGAPVATASMFVVNGSVVMDNGATIQNNAGAAVFTVKNGGYLETNKATITRNYRPGVEAVATVAAGGKWVINEGTEISHNFSRSGNGGLCRVYGTVIINDGLFTRNAAIGNGSIFMVYTDGSYLEMNDGLFTENYCLNHNGNNWNGVIHVHYTGPTTFVMNGGEISNNYGSYCGGLSASKGGNPANITINGGKIVDNVSAINGRDVTLGQNITIAGDVTVDEMKAYRDVTVTAGKTLKVLDTLYLWKSGANIAYNGEGTVDGNVYLYNGVDVTMNGGSWLNGRVTVNAIGTGTTLFVKPGATIDGTQVRVLDSVASGDYLNAAEATDAQTASYDADEGAVVKSPVLFYHRLTSAQKTGTVITYDYNGGLDASGWSGCQIVGTDSTPVPTKAGFKLVGWVYAEDNNPESLSMAGNVAYAGEEITSSARLIAQWESSYVCYIKETGVYYETLTAAVAAANKLAGANTIVMIKDIDFDSTKALTVTGGLTIVSEAGTNHVISRGAYTGTLFNVAKGNSLTLTGGIVFDGNNNWVMDMDLYNKHLTEMSRQGISIYTTEYTKEYFTAYNTEKALQYFTPEEGAPVASAFMIKATGGTVNLMDVTIKNNFSRTSGLVSASAGTIVNLEGAQIKHCAGTELSGVVVQASGKNIAINIKEGTLIDGNHVGGNHGLFKVYSGAVANMSGGTISNTTGWNSNGVVLGMYGAGSTFNMSGGLITGNSSVFGADNGRNAAVYLHNSSTMNMTGGTISFNNGRARGGIDSYYPNSTLNINRADQDFDNAEWKESGAAAYTASNHPMIVDNLSRYENYNYDVGCSGNNYEHWWITGGIYTQDVDEFCAEGYVCIPYTDTERPDDYIVVPGYRVKYYAVETIDGEIQTTLLKKEFHLLPRDKFWYEMDERADYCEWTDEKTGGVISTWYTEKELKNVYDFANTKLEDDLDLYGEWNFETISVYVSKIWDDGNDQDGLRPDSIIINLLADGQSTGQSVTLNKENEWTATFANLRVMANGQNIVYTVDEVEVDGYTTEISGTAATGYTITNKYTPETVSVSGTKVWADGNNQDGIRPETVTIKLFADGEDTGKTTTATADSQWAFSFTGLAKNRDGGTEIVYTIAEESVAEYAAEITGNAKDGFTVTNKHTPGLTSVTVTKVWNDADNQDGIRPDSITVILKANGTEVDGKSVTLSEANGWTYTWENLAKKAGGSEIIYTVNEVEVEGYTSVISGDAAKGFTITNTHDTDTTSVTGKKIWNDNGNQDNIRPDSITVILYANGDEYARKTVVGEGNEWTFEFTGLPVNKVGKVIEYTVDEVEVDGYTKTIDGATITNTQKQYASVTVSGRKVWNDGNNQDGIRPDVITVILKADGVEVDRVSVNKEMDSWNFKFTDLPANKNGKAIEYTVDEVDVDGYTKTINGTTITNTHTPATVSVEGGTTWVDGNDQDGLRPESITIRLLADGTEIDSKTVTAESGWSWNFNGLPKFDNGVEITYTISEDAVIGYSVTVNGYDVTNTHTPAIVSVEGSKTWHDANNQDGKRPESITIRLLADGTEIDSKIVTAESGWSWNFNGLPQYRDGGVEIRYTITEDAVAEYSTEINGYDVTNSYTPGLTSVTVTKVWNDADNQDGIRPDSVTVKLLADGKDTGKVATLSKDNSWTYTWAELAEKAAGRIIAYTVKESVPEGYTAEIAGDATTGYTITNTHVPATVTVKGTKVWEDYNDLNRVRPESITIRLLADGVEKDGKTVTAESGWTWNFNNLPKYKDGGVEIVYTITEDDVAWYKEPVITGNVEDGFTVTNTYNAPVVDDEDTEKVYTIDIVWKDNNNAAGVRPKHVIVELLRDGAQQGSKNVNVKDSDNWTASKTLDAAYHWVASLKSTGNIPDGYTFAVAQSGTHIVVTFTYGMEIEDENVPMAGGNDVIILDEDVPLIDAPATGDPLTVMAAMSILSGAGVFLTRKKREDEE